MPMRSESRQLVSGDSGNSGNFLAGRSPEKNISGHPRANDVDLHQMLAMSDPSQ